MFDSFTDEGRRTVSLVSKCAQRLQHGTIGPEHFLLALVERGKGPVVETLFALNVTPRDVWDQVRGRGQAEIIADPPATLPFNAGAKHLLRHSLLESKRLGHNYVGPEHLLMGLISHVENPWAEPELVADILELLGVSPQRLRQELLGRLPAGDPEG